MLSWIFSASFILKQVITGGLLKQVITGGLLKQVITGGLLVFFFIITKLQYNQA